MCNCSSGTIVLCTDSAAALGFVKRKGASRRTRHVDTKIYFMQAWAMEPGQRILKVHGDSQQVVDCICENYDSSSCSSSSTGSVTGCSILSYIYEGVQNIVAHQNTASVSITFTVTFPIIMRMKFGTTLQHVVSTR